MERKKVTSKYALPCMFGGFDYDFDLEDLFFVTFNTTDEKKALALASCVCGNSAPKALVIINEFGEITYL